MLTRVSLDPDCHQKLPDVSLRVFGGVNKQSKNSGGKLSATHHSRLRQSAFIRNPKFFQRFLHLTIERRNQIPGGPVLGSVPFPRFPDIPTVRRSELHLWHT